MAQKEKSQTTKIGRPKLPKGEAKSCMVRARVTPEEHKKIFAAAKQNGSEVSEWVRNAILEALSR